MKLRSLVVVPICAQMGWSAITLTMKDPKNQPIAGVSCSQGGNTATSDAQGVLTISGTIGILHPVQGPRNAPRFHLPIANGEKTSVTVFDSRGKRVAFREIQLGERFDFASPNPGVFHIRVQGRDFSVIQSVVTMGQGMSFTGVDRDASVGTGTSLRKAGAAAEITCSKPGYATKVFQVNDGDNKTIGFGVPFGRSFDPNAYPKYPGFNLEIAEDFTTSQWPAGLTWDANFNSNDAIWEPSDGGFNDNRVRFDPSSVLLKDDALVLRMEQANMPGTPSHSERDNCDAASVVNPACTQNAPQRNLKSGEIRTKNLDFRFGRYEITIDPPDVEASNGFLAAMFTWYTPRDRHWREIDIEVMGAHEANGTPITDSYLTNIFYANKVFAYSPNIEMKNDKTKPGNNYNARNSNTYAFEWLPTSVKWYVNGNLVRSIGTGGQAMANGIEISQLSSKVVMNFWVLNNPVASIGGTGSANKYPLEAKFDNFRYYRWDQDGDKVTYPEIPCVNRTSPTCKQ